jgi:hypothetical protein
VNNSLLFGTLDIQLNTPFPSLTETAPQSSKSTRFAGSDGLVLLQFHRLHGGSHAVEVSVDAQTSCPGTDQMAPYLSVDGLSWCGRATTSSSKQGERLQDQHKLAMSQRCSYPEHPSVVLNVNTARICQRGTEGLGRMQLGAGAGGENGRDSPTARTYTPYPMSGNRSSPPWSHLPSSLGSMSSRLQPVLDLPRLKKPVRSQVPPGAWPDIGETWYLDVTSFQDGFHHRVHKIKRGFGYHAGARLGEH